MSSGTMSLRRVALAATDCHPLLRPLTFKADHHGLTLGEIGGVSPNRSFESNVSSSFGGANNGTLCLATFMQSDYGWQQ